MSLEMGVSRSRTIDKPISSTHHPRIHECVIWSMGVLKYEYENILEKITKRHIQVFKHPFFNVLESTMNQKK